MKISLQSTRSKEQTLSSASLRSLFPSLRLWRISRKEQLTRAIAATIVWSVDVSTSTTRNTGTSLMKLWVDLCTQTLFTWMSTKLSLKRRQRLSVWFAICTTVMMNLVAFSLLAVPSLSCLPCSPIVNLASARVSQNQTLFARTQPMLPSTKLHSFSRLRLEKLP